MMTVQLSPLLIHLILGLESRAFITFNDISPTGGPGG